MNTRGCNGRQPAQRLNVPLAVLRHLGHTSESRRLPALLAALAAAGQPTSRATLNRTLTDFDAHLGVAVRYDATGGRNTGRLYVAESGLLDPARVLGGGRRRSLGAGPRPTIDRG